MAAEKSVFWWEHVFPAVTMEMVHLHQEAIASGKPSVKTVGDEAQCTCAYPMFAHADLFMFMFMQTPTAIMDVAAPNAH